MIKILTATPVAPFCIELLFSNGIQGIWRAEKLLNQHQGPLLEPLRQVDYFNRFFIDAGALSWPNGLEFSPERLYEDCELLRKAAA